MKNLGPAVFKIAVLSFAVATLVIGQNTAHAQSDSSDDGAVVLHGCPDTYVVQGQSDDHLYNYDVCADIVFTPSGNINATLHGALLDPSTAPSHAVIVRDFPCQYGSFITYDSFIVISPDGSVNGHCELHKQ